MAVMTDNGDGQMPSFLRGGWGVRSANGQARCCYIWQLFVLYTSFGHEFHGKVNLPVFKYLQATYSNYCSELRGFELV